MFACKLNPSLCSRSAKLLRNPLRKHVGCLVLGGSRHSQINANDTLTLHNEKPEGSSSELRDRLEESKSLSTQETNEMSKVKEDLPFDYSFFKQIIKDPASSKGKKLHVLPSTVNMGTDNQSLSELVEVQPVKHDIINLANIKPKLPAKHQHLAAYANESVTLQKFVQLGVDLSVVEKNIDSAEKLLKADFDTDIKPYLMFLIQQGVPKDKLGNFVTKNPTVFKESMENLEIRINYMESKRLEAAEIANIITRCPKVLSLSTKELDSQLGFIQKEFGLAGSEVRRVIVRCPQIAMVNRHILHNSHLLLRGIAGFTPQECNIILLNVPKIYMEDPYSLESVFDYLHNVVGISHKLIVAWPHILRTRLKIIKPRHQFLKILGLDQFDPEKENYVSLKDLVTNTDQNFSFNVAKEHVEKYNDFLKTL